jgi:hypothetical protein
LCPPFFCLEAPMLQPVLSDAEALEWLRHAGGTTLSQCELARMWSWNEMRVSRRLRQWEDERHIIRQNGAIYYRTVTAITVDNQCDNGVDNIAITAASIHITPTRTPTCFRLTSALLCGCAFALFGTAVCANGLYAWSLGSSDVAGAVFSAIGIAADTPVFLLPSVSAAQWRSGRRMRSIVGWAVYGPALVFALAGSVGFASLNIADVVAARSSRSSPAIELAQRRLDVATKQSVAECGRVGPLCRARQAEERQALADLGVARRAVEAAADPQVAKAVALVAWMTPWTPSGEDVALGRLALLVLLPQMAGLVLMCGRRR